MILYFTQKLSECDILQFVVTYLQPDIVIGDRTIDNVILMHKLLTLVTIVIFSCSFTAFLGILNAAEILYISKIQRNQPAK